jgi:ApaG protein
MKRTVYVPEQSEPDQDRYVFAYTINIHNQGEKAARLLNRHWLISDADGKTQEVEGEGVVGKQPYLTPGETFEYTSATLINTPVGSMRGSYEMIDDEGLIFQADIPIFTLAQPHVLN